MCTFSYQFLLAVGIFWSVNFIWTDVCTGTNLKHESNVLHNHYDFGPILVYVRLYNERAYEYSVFVYHHNKHCHHQRVNAV